MSTLEIATVHTHPYTAKELDDYLSQKQRGIATFGTGIHDGDSSNTGMPNIVIWEDFDFSSKQFEKGGIGSSVYFSSVGKMITQEGCE